MLTILGSRGMPGSRWQSGAIAILMVAGCAAHAQSLKDGLVAYWNFDKSDFKDSIGHFDGTANGSNPISFVPGKTGFGSAIQLDGVDQMIEITGDPDPDALAFPGGSITIAGWFTVDAFDKSWQALIAKGEGSNWRIHRNGSNPTLTYSGGVGEGPNDGPDVTDGGWHHFAAVTDADGANFGAALYVDGQLTAVNAGTATLATNGKNVMIGENPDARNRYWSGKVDDLAIWNRVLTQAEVASLYNNGTGKALSAFFAPATDTDNDGMPNDWELKYGLNPNDATDATKDANNNGITNLDEFKKGFDPTDTVKPTITSIATTASFDSVILTYSKPLDIATATNIANYSITPSLAITGASMKGTVVTLTTAKQTPGATAYTVTVNNVKSINALTIAANTKATFYSYILTKTGALKFSYWGGIDSTPVDNLYNDPRYPNSPDLVTGVYSFNSRDAFPDDSHESYGATIEGYLTPAESGSYRFFIYSDDASQLFLSTDDKEANLAQIAEETGCCNNFTEPDSPRTSEPIALTAGKRYYIRLVYKEGGGGDYGQVAWRKEGDKTPADTLRPISGAYLSSPIDVAYPANGVFVSRTPAPDAKNVQPGTAITIVHSDGNTPWASTNIALYLDGVAGTPNFSKIGNTATITYQPSSLLPSKTKHLVSLVYRDPANKLATNAWSFETLAYGAPVADVVHGYQGLVVGAAKQSADKGGHTGAAGDRSMDLGAKGGATVFVPDASWLNTATAADEMTFSIWVKRYDINASSAFWAASPTSNNSQRGWQAHTPWSDNNIYFDTAGCCDAGTQRVNADVGTFGGYTDVSWWTNTWRHLVFTKKGATKRVYIDGTLFIDGSNTAPLPTDITTLTLGGDNTITGNNMHAQIDDFAVFGTALSEADIKKLKAGTAPADLGAAAKLMALWNFDQVSDPGSVTKGLVAYWSFDSNLNDAVNGHNGTAKGTGVGYADGQAGFGKSLKLDGKSYVEIDQGNDDQLDFPNGSVSISGWFKVGAWDKDWQAILAKGENNNYRIARRGGAADGNGIAYAGGAGEGPSDVPAVNDGLWHHFVAVSDASGVPFGTALYVDGVLHSVQTNKPAITATTKHLFIGENPDALNRQFNGELDDIGIWNRVLTPAEVAVLWNGGAGAPIGTFPITPPASDIKLTVTRAAAGLTIAWSPAGGTLESSPTLGAGAVWTPVAGAGNPATVAIGAGNLYYRVKQ